LLYKLYEYPAFLLLTSYTARKIVNITVTQDLQVSGKRWIQPDADADVDINTDLDTDTNSDMDTHTPRGYKLGCGHGHRHEWEWTHMEAYRNSPINRPATNLSPFTLRLKICS